MSNVHLDVPIHNDRVGFSLVGGRPFMGRKSLASAPGINLQSFASWPKIKGPPPAKEPGFSNGLLDPIRSVIWPPPDYRALIDF